jgi:uncharacterized protein YfdQ (DUF2303 family)
MDYHRTTGGTTTPEWTEHTASLKLSPTPEWARWRGKNRTTHAQRDFAELCRVIAHSRHHTDHAQTLFRFA